MKDRKKKPGKSGTRDQVEGRLHQVKGEGRCPRDHGKGLRQPQAGKQGQGREASRQGAGEDRPGEAGPGEVGDPNCAVRLHFLRHQGRSPAGDSLSPRGYSDGTAAMARDGVTYGGMMRGANSSRRPRGVGSGRLHSLRHSLQTDHPPTPRGRMRRSEDNPYRTDACLIAGPGIAFRSGRPQGAGPGLMVGRSADMRRVCIWDEPARVSFEQRPAGADSSAPRCRRRGE